MSAFVQDTAGSVAVGTTTNSLAYSSNNTLGDLLVALIWWDGSGSYTPAVTDSQGNTWSLAGSPAHTSSTNFVNLWCQVAYAANCKAGANTVTVTYSGGTPQYNYINIAEFSGPTATDQIATASGTTANPSASATPGQANEVVVAMFVGDMSVVSAVSGFTVWGGNQAGGGGWGSAYQVQTTATAATATSTGNSPSDWCCQLVTFGTGGTTKKGNSLMMMGCGT